FLNGTAARLHANGEHNQRCCGKARSAEREYAGIADRTNNVTDDDRSRYRSHAAKRGGYTRARRARAGRVKLGGIGIEAGPHAEHEELHDKAADEQGRSGCRMAIDVGHHRAKKKKQRRGELAPDTLKARRRNIKAGNSAKRYKSDEADRLHHREALLSEDDRKPGGQAIKAEQRKE